MAHTQERMRGAGRCNSMQPWLLTGHAAAPIGNKGWRWVCVCARRKACNANEARTNANGLRREIVRATGLLPAAGGAVGRALRAELGRVALLGGKQVGAEQRRRRHVLAVIPACMPRESGSALGNGSSGRLPGVQESTGAAGKTTNGEERQSRNCGKGVWFALGAAKGFGRRGRMHTLRRAARSACPSCIPAAPAAPCAPAPAQSHGFLRSLLRSLDAPCLVISRTPVPCDVPRFARVRWAPHAPHPIAHPSSHSTVAPKFHGGGPHSCRLAAVTN